MHRWYWKGVYQDGTVILQNDINPESGKEWSSDHLDPDNLQFLILEPKIAGQQQVILEIKPGQKARRFWRRYLPTTGPQAGQSLTCWALSLEESGVMFYAFFMPGGEFILTTNPEGSEYQLPEVPTIVPPTPDSL